MVLNFADEAALVALSLDGVGPCAARDLLTGQDLPPVASADYQLALEPLAGHVLLLTAQ